MAFLVAIVGLVLVVSFVATKLIWRILYGKTYSKKIDHPKRGVGEPHDTSEIEPLHDFDWATTRPLEFRPFKPVYYITMGLRSALPSDLITIDSNYLSRIKLRKETMINHAAYTIGCLPLGAAAVEELYVYLLQDYLPRRYPSLFSKDDRLFHNRVTNTSIPSNPPADPTQALSYLGETVEDDMFLLQSTSEGHRCTAFLCTSPSGFDPSAKIGKLLKDIHAPVPSYEKIGPSMERYFTRVEVGKNATRVNWSVTTSPELFNVGSNHVHEGDSVEEDIEVDIPKVRARMELQTLSRLPKTKALLFSFKTYTYPIEDIKAEGLGPQLADAIEGLKTGNAPGMWTYKGGVRWGKKVCEYLRS